MKTPWVLLYDQHALYVYNSVGSVEVIHILYKPASSPKQKDVRTCLDLFVLS
jgi:hypothetical protein